MIKDKKWRLFINDETDYSMSMAMADAIFTLLQEEKPNPFISFNRVQTNTLMIARNQRVNNDVNESVLKQNGIKLARRIMGGKALILTPNDIHYFIVGRTEKEETKETKETIMKLINQLLAKGLNKLAVKEKVVRINEVEEQEETRFHRACFLTPHRYELCVDGKKLGGFTHMTKDKTFIHEGYIPYENYAEPLMLLLKARPSEDKEKYVRTLSEETTSLNEIVKPDITYATIIESLVEEMSQGLHVSFEKGIYTPEEMDLGKKLYDEKYNHDVWTYRR